MKKLIFFLLLLLPTICFAQEKKICEIKFVNGKTDKYYIFDVSETQIWATLYKEYVSSYNPYSFREVFKKEEIALIKCDDIVYWDLSEEQERMNKVKEVFGIKNYNYLKYADEKREPIAAGLLSLLIVGGGQFYNKQPAKGIVMLSGQIVVVTLILSKDITGYSALFFPTISFFDAIGSAYHINTKLREKYGIRFSYKNRTTYLSFSKSF